MSVNIKKLIGILAFDDVYVIVFILTKLWTLKIYKWYTQMGH